MTDAHTGVIAARAATTAGLAPWIFSNQLSRLVIDPERFPDAWEEMRAVGMGAVYLRTSQGAPLRPDDPGHGADLLASTTAPTQVLADGHADLLSVGRGALADPGYPRRVAAGEPVVPFDHGMLQPLATLDNTAAWRQRQADLVS